MNRLLALPRLFRLPNLLIVFLTQWVPYWLVLRPALLRAGAIPALTPRTFGLVVAATLLTTLSGYVINDYFDHPIDRINRPDRVVVGRYLAPSLALAFYVALLGAILFLAWRIDLVLPSGAQHWPLWLFPGVALVLFLYAWQLKCSPLIGNLLVALMCAVVPVVVLLPEERPVWLASFQQPAAIQAATGLLWWYAVFAFLTNLLREQIKDLEDFEGDAACGCGTLAVLKGRRFARLPAVLTALVVSALTFFLLRFWSETGRAPEHLWTGGVLLLLPALFTTAAIYRATEKRDYSRASALIKFIMVAGLFLLGF
jgi:4-hydroxybenzoate polyprenyltransferase